MERIGEGQQNRSDPAGGGQAAAADLWVERYGDVLYRFALVRVQNAAVAEDLVQETFVAALKSQGSFRGKSSEQTWLVGILKHKVIDHFRSRNATVSIEETTLSCADPDRPAPALKIPLKEWDVTPEKAVEDSSFREALQSCLDGLPEKAREIFLMREVEDVGSAELCKVFGITATNLWVTLHRIRNQLRNCLQKNWFK